MPSFKQHLERRDNIAAILQHLRAYGPQSRRQIADALTLSWGCVSELTLMLLNQTILLEQDLPRQNTKGRTPSVLSLNPDICFLGVDINRKALSGCVCDLSGKKLAAYSDTLRYGTKEELLACLLDFIKPLITRHKGIRGIGFAMQGIFDRNRQMWQFSSDILMDFDRDICPQLAVPVTVDHDPNCVLYDRLDSARSRKMILRLDNGIGAAVYTGSEFMRTDLLEIAALVVNEQGQRLRDVVSTDMLKNSSDPAAFRQAGMYLGITLGNICNLLTLDEILICGELVARYDRFSPALNEYYEATVLPAQKAVISPVPVTDAAYGAAKMAVDKFPYTEGVAK